MHSRPSFSEIEPLLVDRRVDKDRDTLHCLFECPVTHRQVSASAHIRQGSGFKDRLLDSAARSFWHELRQAVARTVCSFLPHGFVRDVVHGTAWHMSWHRGREDEVTSGTEVNEATVDAFLSVQGQFAHDGEGWRAREVVTDFVTDFERQVREYPITTRYEGEILARALNSLAALDGLDSSELTFLQDFGIDAADHRPPTRVELSELRDEVKPTVYLLACACALIDQRRSSLEQAILSQMEEGLGLSPARAEALRRSAGQFLVEQSLGVDTQPGPEEIRQLAGTAGLTPEEVERVMVRRWKRSYSS